MEDIFKTTPTYASFAKNFMDSGLKFTLNALASSHPQLDFSELKRAYVEEWNTMPDKSKAPEDVIAKYMKKLFSEEEDVDITETSSQKNQEDPYQA